MGISTQGADRAPVIVAGFRALLRVCTAVAAIGVAGLGTTGAAFAQDTTGTAVLDIPTQPVGAALVAFSSQTGIQVFVTTADAGSHVSTAVSGPLTPSAALDRILSGTGLTYSFTGANTVTVSAPSVEVGAILEDGSYMLGTIYVRGASGTWGPVEGIVAEYTGTGSKTEAAVRDIPAAISVITTDEMEIRGVNNLDDVLNYSAGVATGTLGDNRYDYYAIRGFNQYTSGTYRDGLQARVYNLTNARIEPFGMERVEIMRGSTSTLYGTNLPGGMVNMITKRPLDYAFGEVYSTVGENHLEFGVDFGSPLDAGGIWTYRLTAKVQEATLENGYSRDDRVYFAPALTWRPTDATSLTLMADYQEREGSPVSSAIPIGSGIDPWTFLGEPSFNTYDTVEKGFGFAFEHDFGNGFVLRSHGRASEVTLDTQSVMAMGATTSPVSRRSSWLVDGDLERQSIDAHLQYSTSFGNFTSRTLVGADFTRTSSFEDVYYHAGGVGGVGDLENPVYCGNDCISIRPYYTADVNEETTGLYLQEELTFNEDWILTLGLRRDQVGGDAINAMAGMPAPFGVTESEIDDTATTMRAGLTWRATDGLTFYGTYSESFSPVLPSNQVAASAYTFNGLLTTYYGLSEPFYTFDPMRGEMYELGAKWEPTGMNALFTLALFDITQTNVPRNNGYVMTEIPGIPGAQALPDFGQHGEIRSRGIELEGRAELNERTNLTFAYSYIDAEITQGMAEGQDGMTPEFIPDQTASVWVDYTIPGIGARGDMTLGLGARYVGERFGEEVTNTLVLDSYTVFDAAVRYQVAENTALTLNVANLFDERYIVSADDYQMTAFYGDPRSITLTLQHTW